MRVLCLIVLTALTGMTTKASAEPLEKPTVKVTIRVERERGGSCSEVHADIAGAPSVMSMTDICHGWSTTSCGDKLFFRGEGVIEDQAQVLFTDDRRAMDAVLLVDQGIRARWPGDEHLHLTFGMPRCDGSALVAPFSGSHLRAKADGPASGFRGVLHITNTRVHHVTLEPER